MKPVLLSFHLPLIGEVTFPAYFTLLTLGFLAALWLSSRQAPRLGLDRERIIDVNLWAIVWGIVGARVLHVIADGHFMEYVHLCTDPKQVPAIDALVSTCRTNAQCGYDYLCDPLRHVCYPPQDCLAALKIWRGGLAYYGGFLFAFVYLYWFIRRHRMNWWRVADMASPAIALGLVFGRVGCYLNGCCYGKLTSSSWGVVFPRWSPAWRAQRDAGLVSVVEQARPVHATQLYEAAACLAIFLVLYYVVARWKRRDGDVCAWWLILYAVARSVVEIWRDDDRGVFFGFLSTSQLISLPLLALGLWVLLGRRGGGDTQAAVAPPQAESDVGGDGRGA